MSSALKLLSVVITQNFSVSGCPLRGFSVREGHTSYLEFRFSFADRFFLTCGAIRCVISLCLRLLGYGTVV
jgi:hypothetical protein